MKSVLGKLMVMVTVYVMTLGGFVADLPIETDSSYQIEIESSDEDTYETNIIIDCENDEYVE